MAYLIDTNIISEIQKGSKANKGVQEWYESIKSDEIYLSVLVIGEIRQGIERLRRRNKEQAMVLEERLQKIREVFDKRILPITLDIANRWAINNVPDPFPVIDGLLAATAITHDLVFVTRNIKDVERSEVQLLNPFS
ncbi:MAG: type II toxin-antitoxin system VapC family toxin [Spirochaetota bacterium]|nr:type II toxin-antitoxin system VapC family toxin [Spirochaetota bacterium]